MSEENTSQAPQSTEEELIAVRRDKLAKLKELGIDPFGARFKTTIAPGELKANFSNDKSVTIAGRLLAIRDMGKSVFATLGDAHGRIQIYINKKEVSELEWSAYQLLDLGDWIGISGVTFTTGKGEPSVKASSLTVLSKALRPMPDKWHGLSDRETKYRKRHLDLMSNQSSADLFIMRSQIVAEIRNFLHERSYIEVETPMLHDVAGGAAAKPFKTHHNALSMDLTMRIAPELHLKRLLVGGLTKVFELNRNFRNEGISRRHNPEFTMLEAYQAYGDFEIMADLVEEMVCHLAEKFFGTLEIEHKDENGEHLRTINLNRPWKRAPYQDLIKEAAGSDWFDLSPEERRAKAKSEFKLEIHDHLEDYEVSQQVFEKLIEEHTFDPCFVTHVDSKLIPLAKENIENPAVIDVYELIINGQEISPGYSELNDPDTQRRRLHEQSGGEAQEIDEDFVEALEHGMPPAGGIGIGIDRLIMLLTGAPTIRDVVLFPQLKRKD
ncbi:lysine--tRNA ligase [Akkermansiaceae bacterium]|nr:lysine--tRNA ligase [Akkermansiaceae bacterium]MDA8969227.1 lysine--tRNA ligase [Akkermansiaceae bacterium]MDB4429888.1 lysine--tRNA ligase [Akkermansiaceae bacterium]MDB4504622.1 lysine--tRNA ligase [Akkermansiaceae bacterium]MDB4547190.1 lysine--tRNA ligase [Akkermansiaceae bacterium]